MAQTTDYTCGPASLLSVLYYWKATDDEEPDLYGLLETTSKDGTRPEKLAEGARHYGLQAHLQDGLSLEDLKAALKRRETVILDIQAWRDDDPTPETWEDNWEDGHYVVLIGMDASYVYVMDPSTPLRYGYIPARELLTRWHDYHEADGKRQERRHQAVVISGKESLRSYPAGLLRVR